MTRLLIALYGLGSYVLFTLTFLYAIAFIGGLPVPKAIDTGPPAGTPQAVAVDLLLLLMFGVQHSVMARAGFKKAWTRVVSPAIERSTYVLASSAGLAVLMVFWLPIAQPVVWSVEAGWVVAGIQALFWTGWLLILASTFLINHFELTGLQQVAARVFKLKIPEPQFRTPLLYRLVRHPLYVGFLVAFWATPRMTAGHLLFAAGMTAYILVGIHFEERDLVALFGERYRDYQRKVGMLFPRRGA